MIPLWTTANSHLGSDLFFVSYASPFFVLCLLLVWMAVLPAWRSVGGPSSVCDTGVGVEDLVHVDARGVDEFSELGHFSHLFEREDFIPLVAVDCETSRVVTSVL